MAKKDFFQRYKSILKYLSNKRYATYDELRNYLYKEVSFMADESDVDLSFSKRTFQRDIKEIEQIWGFSIVFCSKNKGYFIDTDASSFSHNKRLFEVLEIQNALQLADDVKNVIFFEDRRVLNLHLIDDVVNAIKRKCIIHITYKKFEEQSAQLKKIEPYAIKEYKNRWYIIAKDYGKTNIKIYALDRVVTLSITQDRFQKDPDLDVTKLYENIFGIFLTDNGKMEHIILEFEAKFGNYIKTLPLHSSQNIIKEDINTLKVSLDLIITREFVEELLSYGAQVTVIAPAVLVKTIKKEITAMQSKYL